jgi:hypothetical protein
MKLSLLIFAALISLTPGCAPPAQLPNKEKAKLYPPVVKASPERLALVNQEWRRLLETYGVAGVEPELFPISATPRSLANLPNGIKLVNTQIQPGTEEVTVREAARKFIDRWRELLAVDPATMSLSGSRNQSGVYGLQYQQSSYPFPIAGGFGEMSLRITGDGRLVQLEDRFIPLVEVPLKAVIERQAAAQRVANRTFTYRNTAGQPQTVKIEAAEVMVKELVIYPVEKGETLEMHLAWEIVAGKSLTWSVYIDAITGEDLGIIQRFNT